MHQFTIKDLIQFLYEETSTEKKAAIQVALDSDWSLREKMEKISLSHSELNGITLLSPSDKTLENIFKYAQKSISNVAENA